jgi:hypothetical protein
MFSTESESLLKNKDEKNDLFSGVTPVKNRGRAFRGNWRKQNANFCCNR